MGVKLRIPTPLRQFTGDQADVEVPGKTIKEAMNNLEAKHPGIRERVIDEKGAIRQFVNFYLNEEDIRFLDGIETPLKDGDQVTIVPAIAGGCILSIRD